MALFPEFDWNPFKLCRKYLVEDPEKSRYDAYFTSYLISVTWHWTNLRCVSYCLDVIDGVTKNPLPGYSKGQELLDFLCYIFYFPVCISGPVIVYRNFHKGVSAENFLPVRSLLIYKFSVPFRSKTMDNQQTQKFGLQHASIWLLDLLWAHYEPLILSSFAQVLHGDPERL